MRVEAERPRERSGDERAARGSGEVHHTSSAYLTMVAVDEDGRPVAVAPLRADDAEEERRERDAQVRWRNRLAGATRSVAPASPSDPC